MWPDTAVLSFKAWPSGDRYDFSDAAYDPAADRLELTWGPPTAASAHVTPEGHIVRTAAPAGYLCGLVLTNLHQRLEDHGRVEVTLGPLAYVCLTVSEIAHALTDSVEQQRTGRFARSGREGQRGTGAAGAAAPTALSVLGA